jgi:hypothetical protein
MRKHLPLYSAHISNILEVQCNVLKQGKAAECEIGGFYSGADENLSHLDCETIASRRG